MRPATPSSIRRLLAGLAAVAGVAALAACTPAAGAAPTYRDLGPARELRLGYFATVTHAAALVGVGKGFFAASLGRTRLSTQVFNAGPAAIEALNAGAIDAAFVGPGPAINGFVSSKGQGLRIVSGAASGGAELVVRPQISSAQDLRGKELATPQLGGTQDVALRHWLSTQGLHTSLHGGGDVTITPTDNAQTLQLFRQGRLDGAWLPEPWASRLVLDAGARVLVDERSLWPKGQLLTTNLIVSTRYLREHPASVRALINGEVQSVDWLRTHASDSPAVVNAEIAKAAGKPLSDDVIRRALGTITVTLDPLAATLRQVQAHAVSAGLTGNASLSGIYDLRLLNAVLTGLERPPVSAAGLGEA